VGVSAQKALGRISVTEAIGPVLDSLVIDHPAGIYIGQCIMGHEMVVMFLINLRDKGLLLE
jgi:hypothetical protein